jgi:hypothetical protein
MEDVTDASFRGICREQGADMVYTEFIPSEGLIRDARKAYEKMKTSDAEAPIGIQIYGSDPDAMVEAARMADHATELVGGHGCDLIDINSKNGTMLLNIGPKEDGTFTEEETHILSEIGKWMEKNGEALLQSKPYRIFGEGPTDIVEGGFQDAAVKEFTSADFRFFAGNGSIYAIALRPSADGEYLIKNFARKQGNLNTEIRSITCLSEEKQVMYDHRPDGLRICCETGGEYPVVFRIALR